MVSSRIIMTLNIVFSYRYHELQVEILFSNENRPLASWCMADVWSVRGGGSGSSLSSGPTGARSGPSLSSGPSGGRGAHSPLVPLGGLVLTLLWSLWGTLTLLWSLGGSGSSLPGPPGGPMWPIPWCTWWYFWAYILLPQWFLGRSHGTPFPPELNRLTDKYMWKHYLPAHYVCGR